MNKVSHFLLHIWSPAAVSCFSTAARRALFRRVHPRLAPSIILTHPTPYTPWTGMPIPYLGQRECPLKPWTGTETFEICCKFLVLLQTFADFSRMNLLLFLQIFFFKRTKTYSTNYSCILPRGGGVVTFFSLYKFNMPQQLPLFNISCIFSIGMSNTQNTVSKAVPRHRSGIWVWVLHGSENRVLLPWQATASLKNSTS